jgi:hypothetical protein
MLEQEDKVVQVKPQVQMVHQVQQVIMEQQVKVVQEHLHQVQVVLQVLRV